MNVPLASKTDAIVTAVSGYEPGHMAIWLNSLEKTGFNGKVFVIAYDVSENLVEYLKSRDVITLTFNHDRKNRKYTYSQVAEEIDDHTDNGKLRIDTRWTWLRRILRFKDKVHDRRFYHSSILLDDYCRRTGEEFRFLAFSDARDVYFQDNPFNWLETNLPDDKDFVVSEEPVTHREAWNRRMMIKAFGKRALMRVEDNPVVCCGFFAGRFGPMLELLLANYYFDQSKRIGDQVAFNQLLSFRVWREKTVFSNWREPWTLHSSTAVAPSSEPGFFASSDTLPKFTADEVVTSDGQPYAIVHHHDRHAEFHASLVARFGQP